MGRMLTVPTSTAIAFMDTDEERVALKPIFPVIPNAPQYPSRGVVARIIYKTDGTIRAEYEPGVANYSTWMIRKIPWSRWKSTGSGVWLETTVKEEEAEYIVALTKSQWSEGGECEIVRETVAQERVVQELKPQPRTPEELFKEFEPYMQECFDWFDKHGDYGSQTPHDCWQVSWYGYWIDHKRAQEGKKDFEAYKMFDEVWVIYKDKMLRVEPKPERTVEELFKEFEPYMRKMHELQDSSSTAGNCQRWWKSRWYDFWIGHGHEHLRKDNEAFEMFSEVWTIYEETMTRWPERLRRMQREESVTKPAETVTKEPDIVNEPAQNVIDMAGAVAKKDMGKARSKKDNGFGEQLSLFG